MQFFRATKLQKRVIITGLQILCSLSHHSKNRLHAANKDPSLCKKLVVIKERGLQRPYFDLMWKEHTNLKETNGAYSNSEQLTS